MKIEELIERGLLWSGNPDSRNPDSGDPDSGERRANSGVLEKLPALCFGGVHEWGVDGTPPLLIFRSLLKEKSGPIFWIGERSFPSFALLSDLADSLLVNTCSKAEKLYAMQKALSTRGVLAVIGESRGFSLNTTRQLRLAARKGGAICLLFRPQRELLTASSCANSKWLLKPVPAEQKLCWELTLLRAQSSSYPRSWRVEAPFGCPELKFSELRSSTEKERVYGAA